MFHTHNRLFPELIPQLKCNYKESSKVTNKTIENQSIGKLL